MRYYEFDWIEGHKLFHVHASLIVMSGNRVDTRIHGQLLVSDELSDINPCECTDLFVTYFYSHWFKGILISNTMFEASKMSSLASLSYKEHRIGVEAR